MNALIELTPQDIRDYVLANYEVKSNKEIAIELGVPHMRVVTAYSWLVRKELVPCIKPKQTVEFKVKNIAKIVGKDNSYKDSDSDGCRKNEARSKICDRIVASGLKGTILSLPFYKCTLEKQILEKTKAYRFLGVEHDFKTFKALKKTIRLFDLPIKAYYGKIKNYIYGVKSESYAHAILDYCGFLSTNKMEIRYFLTNKLIPIGGTVHVTFSAYLRGRASIHDDVLQLGKTINNSSNDNRKESEKAIRSWFDKATGFDYEIDEIFFYRDFDVETNTSKMPMCLVQITRIA